MLELQVCSQGSSLRRVRKLDEQNLADQDPEKHRAVRKILAPAFNPRALNEQEPILHKYIDAFVTKAADHSVNGGVDLSEVRLDPKEILARY